MLKILANFREFIVRNFYTKIIAIEYGNNLYKNKFLLWLQNLSSFPITNRILKFFKINYLYIRDDIIFYSKINEAKLGPILFEFKVNNDDIKYIIDKYDNNVPINLIFKNENMIINDSDEIYIKCFSDTVKSKKFNYNLIKFNLKIQLLFLI